MGIRRIGWVFGFLGLAALAAAVFSFMAYSAEVDGYIATTAIVVTDPSAGKPSAAPPDGAAADDVMVRFRTAARREITAPLHIGMFRPVLPTVQNPVAIRYDPGDPGRVLLDHPAVLYEVPILVAAVGFVLLLISRTIARGRGANPGPASAARPRATDRSKTANRNRPAAAQSATGRAWAPAPTGQASPSQGSLASRPAVTETVQRGTANSQGLVIAVLVIAAAAIALVAFLSLAGGLPD